MDYEQDKQSNASGGLQYLIHLEVYHQRFGDGLDMKTMTAEELDLTKMDHGSLYWFSYYIVQRVRGLAEGPIGPYYKHLEGVRYTHAFDMNILVGGKYLALRSFSRSTPPE